MTDYEETHFTDPKNVPLPRELSPAFVVTEDWFNANRFAVSQYVAMRVTGYPRVQSCELAFGWCWSNYTGIDWVKEAGGQSHVDKLALAVECNKWVRGQLNEEIAKASVEELWSKDRAVLTLLDMLNSEKTSDNVKIGIIASLNAITEQSRLPREMQSQIVKTIEALAPGLLISDSEDGNAPGRQETPRARSRWKPSK